MCRIIKAHKCFCKWAGAKEKQDVFLYYKNGLMPLHGGESAHESRLIKLKIRFICFPR